MQNKHQKCPLAQDNRRKKVVEWITNHLGASAEHNDSGNESRKESSLIQHTLRWFRQHTLLPAERFKACASCG